jgi:flagellar motor switch protein FliM
MLSNQIQDAEVDLVAELGNTRATVEQLLGFRPGDFIELDLDPLIKAKVDGVPVLECQYGVNDGHYAIKIEKLLPSTDSVLKGGMNSGR